MQTNARQFNPTHIHPDYRCYLLFGQETMLVEESLILIRHNAKQYEFNERIRFDVDLYFDWNLLTTEIQTQSLFSSKRVVECHISSLANKAPQLLALIESVPADVILVLIIAGFKSAQKNTKWFKSLDKSGVIVGHYELKPQEALNWVHLRMKQLNITPNQALTQSLLLHNEGNLLAMWQELQKLALEYPNGKIDFEQYQANIVEQSNYKPYGLINAALMGNPQQTLKIYLVLKDNNTQALHIINVLNNELRVLSNIAIDAKKIGLIQAMRPYRMWGVKETLAKQALHRHTAAGLQKLMLLLGQLERSSKGQGQYNADQVWHGLLTLLLNLAGQRLWTP